MATQSYAGVTSSAKWKSAEISVEGPKSAGMINISASISENDYLNLKVTSNYGRFEFSNEILSPLLESLTVHRYRQGSGFGKDLFYVCLLYGDRGRANRGTEENPDYHWQHNKVVYLFKPEGSEKRLFKNNEKFWFPSDCSPGYFI